MAEKYSKSPFDYLLAVLILILVRIIYGSPSFLFKLLNVVTFAVFAYDKYQGVNKGYRVAENVLFALCLCGGWVGGLCAMLTLKHKTIKESFLVTMAIISLANVIFVAKYRGLF